MKMLLESSNEQVDDETLNLLKRYGVLYRHPHDPFYKEANDACQPIKPFGICDYEDEDLHHKMYHPFSCHIPRCSKEFETVMQFDTHYNSCHVFTCKECKKNLPNNHLLDLHISETHDFYFVEMAKRKPMFQCFVPECKELFKNPELRHKHCIEIHKFPSDFRFDAYNKIKGRKSKTQKKNTKQDNKDAMDICTESSKNTESKTSKTLKEFSFGQAQGRRKPVFSNFAKDLMDSLPGS